MAAVFAPELAGTPVRNQGITNKMISCSHEKNQISISMLQSALMFPIETLFTSGDQQEMETGNETTRMTH